MILAPGFFSMWSQRNASGDMWRRISGDHIELGLIQHSQFNQMFFCIYNIHYVLDYTESYMFCSFCSKAAALNWRMNISWILSIPIFFGSYLSPSLLGGELRMPLISWSCRLDLWPWYCGTLREPAGACGSQVEAGEAVVRLGGTETAELHRPAQGSARSHWLPSGFF